MSTQHQTTGPEQQPEATDIRDRLRANVPVLIREAFDNAVAARRRFHAARELPNHAERMTERRAALSDLEAANGLLLVFRRNDLVHTAKQVAQQGGAR